MSEKTATCIGSIAGTNGETTWAYRLDPLADAKGRVWDQVLVRDLRGSTQIWGAKPGVESAMLIEMTPGFPGQPHEALKLWQGYVETPLSRLRRAANVYDDAVPFPTSTIDHFPGLVLRPLREHWDGLSVEAKLAAILTAAEAVQLLRFPPLQSVAGARTALRELDRQLAVIEGEKDEEDFDVDDYRD